MGSEMRKRSGRQGFTLIELLCVMGIMVFLLSVALGSALGWGRSSGLRSSVLGVKSSLTLARQLAITHGTQSFFVYGNSTTPVQSGYYVAAIDDPINIVGETNYMPKGFIFETGVWSRVAFQADGACTNGSDPDIVVREIRGMHYLAATVTVVRATGIARSRE